MPPDRRLPASVTLTYDATTDVAYLTLRPTGPADVLGPTLLPFERDPELAGLVALDFSAVDGRVVGFEFLDASATLPAELLLAAERIDGRHLERVLGMRVGRLSRGTTRATPRPV